MRAGVVYTVLISLALAACGRTQGAGATPGGKGGRPPVRVRVAPVAVQDVVYEMRFDDASSWYGEFGPFHVGLHFSLPELPRFLEGEVPLLHRP